MNYSTADVDKASAHEERYVVAGIEAVPEGGQNKHAQSLPGRETFECDHTQPLTRLNVPVVDDTFDIGGRLERHNVDIVEQVPLGRARRLVEAVEAEAARVMHGIAQRPSRVVVQATRVSANVEVDETVPERLADHALIFNDQMI